MMVDISIFLVRCLNHMTEETRFRGDFVVSMVS